MLRCFHFVPQYYCNRISLYCTLSFISMQETPKGHELEDLGELSFNFTAILNLNTQPTESGLANYLMSFFKHEEPMTPRRSMSEPDQSISKLDFSGYLHTLGDGLRLIKRKSTGHKHRHEELFETQQDIMDCFQKVPYLYFERGFCLNFANYGSNSRMRQEQEQLNLYLDLVEINLFNQVTHKFNDFFKILKNLEFLDKSVLDNIQRLRLMRDSVHKLRANYFEIAKGIQKKVLIAQNKEKVLKCLAIVRSLKKLPPTINSILESSLPYQCVSLLSSGKQTYKLVSGLECLKNVGRTLENGDNIVKHSLYKQFSDKIFLYLTAPISPPFTRKLCQIPTMNILQSSTLNQTVIQESFFMEGVQNQEMCNTSTQKQISRIIVQSYLLVDYSSNTQLRVKLNEFVKIITKTFHEQLRTHLYKVVKQAKESSQALNVLDQLNRDSRTPVLTEESSFQTLEELCDQISIPYFGKLMFTYHQMFRCSIMRLMGCTDALVKGFNSLRDLNVEKARHLVQEFLSMAVNLCKIVCDKAIGFLALKKLSHDTAISDFDHYVSQLTFWEENSKTIASLPLFQAEQTSIFGQKLIENRVKLEATFDTLRSTKHQLQEAYISNLHKNVIQNELKSSLEQQTWTNVEDLPYHYKSMFAFILNGDEQPKRTLQKPFINNSLSASFLLDASRRQKNRVIMKPDKPKAIRSHKSEFKLLKNVVLINKRQYKLTVALLLFIEILEQYLKIDQMYPEMHQIMMTKVSQIARTYSFQSYQLILGGGALKFDKIKTKNLTTRHLCLSWNCLLLIQVLLSGLSHSQMQKVSDALNQHCEQIIIQLSSIISKKIDSQISSLYQLNLRPQIACPTEQTRKIVEAYKQMLEIIEEFMTEDIIRKVMQPAVALIIKKYISHLEEKGARGKEEALYFINEMKVLELGFEKQLDLIRKTFVNTE